MKALCVIASKKIVIDGDVAFSKGFTEHGYGAMIYCPNGNIAEFTHAGFTYYSGRPKRGFKLNALWFWHMVILRKEAVYLTGVMK